MSSHVASGGPGGAQAARPKKRALALAAALLCLALAGCTGLPQFNPSGPGRNGAAQAEAGQGEPGLVSGQSNPGTSSSSAAPAPIPFPPVSGPPAPTDPPLTDAPGAPVSVGAPGLGWLVRFARGTETPQMQSVANDRGGTFVFAFRSLPIAYMLATDAQALEIGKDPRVAYIEREMPLQYHDAESKPAVRIPDVISPTTGLHDAAGNPIDGRGIGIAVVDTGIDALHPDLPYGATGVVVANYKVESQQYVALQDTDTTAGHGTHVAAILAGQGTLDPTLKGLAPGAKLYGLGIGEATTTVWSSQAFDWILQNYNSVNPPIRVVTNSWGTTGTYSASSTTTLFVNALVDHGIVVTFSAGNNGGDGTAVKTSPECQNPKAGVICVAAYDDLGTGTRNGVIASYTSRGLSTQSSTWPDISAPGTNVLSARPPVGAVTGAGVNPNYVQLSGTSQATPHVAAIVALMLQKHGSITPATVESTLKSSAYQFTDGGAYVSGSHFAKGAGLVDAYAAVSAA